VGGASPPISLSSRRDTVRLAQRLARALAPGDLVILEGDLGAGKTFFTRALCRALGVPPEVRVTSPTFTLVHEHTGRLPIRHADLYRLHDADEVAALGLREQRADGALLVVEWGGPYLDALGGDGLILRIAVSPAGEREAQVSGTGPRGAMLAARATAAA
jgi:tRNA threonylcarbamoyladenosine biosynthesis protein TsaE